MGAVVSFSFKAMMNQGTQTMFEMMAMVMMTVLSIEMLVWGFFDREIHTAALLILASALYLLPTAANPKVCTRKLSVFSHVMT